MGEPRFYHSARRGPVVDFTGVTTVLGADLVEFADTVKQRIQAGERLTVYCGDVSFIDSRAIGQIIGWRKRVGSEGSVELLGIHPRIAGLLETLRLSPYLILTPMA